MGRKRGDAPFAEEEAEEALPPAEEDVRAAVPEQVRRNSEQILIYSRTNDFEGIEVLLKSGCSPHCTNSAGQSALHIGAMWGSPESVKVLLEAKADPNTLNKMQGSTPIHAAAMGIGTAEKRCDCIRMLIAAGGNPRIGDRMGKMPVNVANDDTVRKMLLASGGGTTTQRQPVQVLPPLPGSLLPPTPSLSSTAPPPPPGLPPGLAALPEQVTLDIRFVKIWRDRITTQIARFGQKHSIDPQQEGTLNLLSVGGVQIYDLDEVAEEDFPLRIVLRRDGQKALAERALKEQLHQQKVLTEHLLQQQAEETLVAMALQSALEQQKRALEAAADALPRAPARASGQHKGQDEAALLKLQADASPELSGVMSVAVKTAATDPDLIAKWLAARGTAADVSSAGDIVSPKSATAVEATAAAESGKSAGAGDSVQVADALQLRLEELLKTAEAKIAAVEAPAGTAANQADSAKAPAEKTAGFWNSKSSQSADQKAKLKAAFQGNSDDEGQGKNGSSKGQASKLIASFRPGMAGPLKSDKSTSVSRLLVCINPLPSTWTEVQLHERFNWYGNLAEASIEWRVRQEDTKKPTSERAVWTVGVLRFIDEATAKEVVKREGGSFEGQAKVEAGMARRSLGWCDGPVISFIAEHGVGLMSCDHGTVHFEVPASTKGAPLALEGCRLEANVEVGADGLLQSKDIRLPQSLLASALGPKLLSGTGTAEESSKKARPRDEDGRAKSRSRRRRSRSGGRDARRARSRDRRGGRGRSRSRSGRNRSRSRGRDAGKTESAKEASSAKRDSRFGSAPSGLGHLTGRQLELQGAKAPADRPNFGGAFAPTSFASTSLVDGLGAVVDSGALDAAKRLAAARLHEVPITGSNNAPMRPGDWVCQVCGGHNFASRGQCFRCHQAAPMGHVDPRTTNMRPGDWICPQCSNHNFAMRHACKRCCGPRPAAGPPGFAGYQSGIAANRPSGLTAAQAQAMGVPFASKTGFS
eukprot:TRINITY_DN38117_c0_g1_i1.p1 TRINITY_DN38117_c0_g1~~TRINITY_DN38117_c0_g1_i1.p1  ORF type:complete len:984 (-),score=186.60 TRINITY_DN38117_c0_g1_i1:58-3009(-)